MPNTNFQTFHQMKGFINKQIQQAEGRENVNLINMDWISVGQNRQIVNGKFGPGSLLAFDGGETAIHPTHFYVYIPKDPNRLNSISVVRRGFNIWNETYEKGYWNVNTGEAVNNDSFLRCKNYIPVVPGTEYRFVCLDTNLNRSNNILFFDSNRNLLSYIDIEKNATFTTPDNCGYIKFYMNLQYGNTYHNDISINYPSNYTGYYQGSALSDSFRLTFSALLTNPGRAVYDIITGLLIIYTDTDYIAYQFNSRDMSLFTSQNNIWTMEGYDIEIIYDITERDVP